MLSFLYKAAAVIAGLMGVHQDNIQISAFAVVFAIFSITTDTIELHDATNRQ